MEKKGDYISQALKIMARISFFQASYTCFKSHLVASFIKAGGYCVVFSFLEVVSENFAYSCFKSQ